MPTRSERRRQKKDGDQAVMIITVDGESYRFDSSEVTSAMDRELFLQSKLTLAKVITAMADETVSPFMIAALVFLSRRAAGETVTYDEIEQAIGFDLELDLQQVDPDGEDDPGPEARAAD